MHAPRLTGTYGRGLVIRGDPISGACRPVCARSGTIKRMTFRYLDLHTPTSSERTHARDTRARARVTQERSSPPCLFSASLSRALLSLFLFPFARFIPLSAVLLPSFSPPSSSSSAAAMQFPVWRTCSVPDTWRARSVYSMYFVEMKFHLIYR